MKHFIHVICEWKLETVSAAHKISLVLALRRNIIIGSDHEMFGLAYKSAVVKLYIFSWSFVCDVSVMQMQCFEVNGILV
jgi:hypothetical protein